MNAVPTSMPRLPRRRRDAHKGDFGRVHILAGQVGYTGAPVLAASGAVRAGAGLVSLSVPEEIYPIVACKLLSAMPSPLKMDENALQTELSRCENQTAVLVGPGMGRSPGAEELTWGLMRNLTCPLVVDADGINALSGHIDVLDERRGRVTVLTPHDGEFARILGRKPSENREEEGVSFAKTHGCILIWKGHRTLTCYPDGRCYVNQTGNPGMAKGGSGDVLAGMVLAFLAQGLPVEWAVYLHGLAGDLAAQKLGEYAMTPGDLIQFLPAAFMRAKRCFR